MLPLHIKKTNNTNKLMQISYHSALTKITKLKKKKRIARNWLVGPVFFSVRNMGVICIGLLTSTVYTGRTSRYGTKSTPLIGTRTCNLLLHHNVHE